MNDIITGNTQQSVCLIKPEKFEDLEEYMKHYYDVKIHDMLFSDEVQYDIFARAKQNKIMCTDFVDAASYLCYYVNSDLFDDFIAAFVAMNKITEATRIEIVGNILKATGSIVAPTVTAILSHCIQNPKLIIGIAGCLIASKGLIDEFGVKECICQLYNITSTSTKAVGWCAWMVQGAASIYMRTNKTV